MLLLTSRIKTIIAYLLETTSYPVTVKEIANKLNVSTRTILRDMPIVEDWLSESNVNFTKKPGVGIVINEDNETKEKLRKLLEEEKILKEYSQDERKNIIICELLMAKEPIKLFYFSNILSVAEGTLSSDLDRVEEWLEKYNIKLIRKPGYGIYIEGRENDYRKAIVNLLYNNLDESQLLQIIKNNFNNEGYKKNRIEVNARKRLLSLIDKETIDNLESLVYEIEKKMNLQLADNAYVGLIVHLALALQRLKNNEKIIIEKDLLGELKELPEFNMAKKLAENMASLFDIDIPIDEVGYITMHLRGAKLGVSEKNEGIVIGKFELIKIAKEIIRTAEKETGIQLQDNEQLLYGLVNHLGPAVNRLKMNLEIRNPLLENIKEKYPYVFEISKKSCMVLQRLLNVDVPESEIGYIAMHIGAAIENKKEKNIVYRVAVACASGIGMSRLLAARLKKEFNNIHVVEIISSINIDEEDLKKKNIDLIISTIDLKSNIKTIYVNPLLLEEDKNKIENILKQIKSTENFKGIEEDANFVDVLNAIEEITKATKEILNNTIFKKSVGAQNIIELIKKVSKIFFDIEEKQKVLEDELKRREELGSTIINGKGIILLHCRSDIIDSLKVGVVKLEKAIGYHMLNNVEENINVAVVLLAPKTVTKNYLDVISEISRAIIDSSSFERSLIEADEKKIYKKISNILEKFYYKKIEQLKVYGITQKSNLNS